MSDEDRWADEMRLSGIILLLAAIVAAFGCDRNAADSKDTFWSRSSFATSGRFLTIQHWQSPEGTTWAVLDDQIVVYRMFDYVDRKDELVLAAPITPEQATAIRDAVRQLPHDVLGFRHDGSLSTHPPMLRIGFRSDDLPDRKGVEISGFVPPWIEPLLATVSSATQPTAPITFQTAVEEYRSRRHSEGPMPPVRKISLAEYNGPAAYGE